MRAAATYRSGRKAAAKAAGERFQPLVAAIYRPFQPRRPSKYPIHKDPARELARRNNVLRSIYG